MKLLLLSATRPEILPLIQMLDAATGGPDAHGRYHYRGHELQLCTGGIGPAATAWALTKALCAERYELVLQAGIGGSFDPALPPGSLALISSEQFGDLGAEDHDARLDIFELGLAPASEAPFRQGILPFSEAGAAYFPELPRATGLTVSMVSGCANTISQRASRYNCQVESMEGAAFHYVCLQEGVVFAQLRSISNFVTPRDRASWQLGPAINALNARLMQLLQQA